MTALKQDLNLLQEGLLKLKSFPEELEVPEADPRCPEVSAKARQEIETLQKVVTEGMELLAKDQLKPAVEKLGHQANEPSVLSLLNQVRESVWDKVEIAQVMKRRSQQAQQVAVLMQVVKEQLLPLQELTGALHKKLLNAQSFKQYPQMPVLASKHQTGLNQAQKIVDNLSKASEQARAHLHQKDLAQATLVLQEADDSVKQARQSIEPLQNSMGEVDIYIKNCKQILEKRSKRLEALKHLRKVQEYLTDLEEQLEPLQNGIRQMNQDFPVAKGYPALPENAESKLSRAQNLALKLKAEMETSRQYLKKWRT